MEKKLLSVILPVFLFFLGSLSGFGQCPTSLSISASPGTTICALTEVTFTANTSGGSGLQYQWQLNSTNIEGATSPTYKTSSLNNGAKLKVVITSTVETCTVTSNELIMTVNAVVTPTVSISPTKTSICAGESITFNTTNTFGGNNPQYSWFINSSNTAAKTGASATFSSSDFTEGNNSVRVVLTSNVNCASSTTAEATSATFVLKPDATISSPSNKDQPICISTPLQTISFALGGGATNATVTGLPPGITGSLSGGNYILSGSPTTKGTYNYTVTTTGTCAQKTATGTITVNPNATISLTSGNSAQTVCAAGGVATGSINPITYSIGETGTGATVTGLPSGITGSFNNGVFTIQGASSVTGTHNYSIKATGTCGESAPLTGSIVITANKTPSVTITSSDGDNTICAGAPVTFTATPTNGGNNPTYQWRVGTTNVGSNSPTFTTTTLTTGQTVTVELRSSETCITSATVTSNPITTTVNPNLTPSVTIESSDSDICPGDSVTFTATPLHGGTNPTYQWRIGNTNVGGANSSTFTTTSLTNGQSVSVVITSNETCLATATATSNTISTTVRPPVPATPGSITGPIQVCATATGLVYSVPAVTNAESYNWTLPSGWIPTGGAGTRSITVSASSTPGNISVSAVNSCGTSEQSNLAVTTVNGVPTTPGTITSSLPANNKNICPPLDNLTFSVSPVSGADSYKWTLPSPGWEIVSGAGTNSIIVRVTSATTNGTKEVRVEAVNICGSSTQSTYSGIEVNTHIIANIGEDKTVCKSENSIILNGTRSFGNANLITNFFSSGTGTFTNGPSGNNQSGPFTVTYLPTPADKNAGQVTITVRVPQPTGNNNSGNQCGSGVDEMILYFRPDATITNLTNKSQAVCINSALDPIVYTLGGTFSGATVTGLPAGVIGSFTNGTFRISGTPTVAGTFNYTVNTTGDCTQTSTTGTITVDPLTTVTAGQAATDIVCQSATPAAIPLTGANFGGGATTAAWSITSGGGTLSSTTQTATPQNVTYTPAANYTGNVVLTLTTNAPGKCAAISATRTITVQPAPTVVPGTAATDIICQSQNPSPITLTGASFGGGATAAAWTITSGGGTLSSTALTANPQNVTYTAAPGYTGAVVLSLISDAPGKCSAVSATRTITVQPAATVEAGEAATDVVCQSGTPSAITLTGASFGGGATTAAWSITSGGGTLSNTAQTATPQNISYTPAANYTGDVVLTLTTNAPGTCAAVNDTRIIKVEPAAIVVAGGVEAGEEGGCQSASPGAITLSGATLSGGAVTAAWSITQGGGSLSSTAQTNKPELVTYTPAPNFTGTAILTLTSAPAGNCAAVSDSRVIRISEALTLNAGPDIDLCSGAVRTLSDITLGSGVTSAKWQIISGQGSLSSTTETSNPGTVTFTAPNNYKGQTILRLTSNNPEGLCEEIFDERTVNIQQQVTITTPPVNLGICSTQNATFEVVASGDNLSYQWLFEGAPIANATDSKLVITRATSADAGSYTVRITGETSCGEPVVSAPVTLNVDEDIVINTQPVGGNYCVGSTINFSVEASAGGAELTYEWFNANNQSVGTGASLALPNAQTSQKGDYYVIITGPAGFTCSTVRSKSVTIVVNPAPVIETIGTAVEICSAGVEANITGGAKVSNESSIEWSVPAGMGTISNPTSLTAATYVPNGATGTIPLTLTVKGLDGCSEIKTTKNITIVPQPAITELSYVTGANTATTGEFCETDTTNYSPHIAGSNLINGMGIFSVDKTGLTINSSTGVISPNGTTPGDYIVTYRYTVSSQSSGCTVAEKTFTVTIGKKPVATFSYASTPFCSDAVNPLPLMGTDAVKGTFSSTTGLVFVDPATGELNIAASTPGIYTVTNTIASANGCAEVKETSTITINQKPAAPGVANISYCLNHTNAPALTATSENGSTLKWYATADGTTALGATPQPNTATAGTTSYWVSQTSAAGCESERAQITVTINALPVVTAQVNQNVICLGSTVQLSATGGVSYTWYIGENSIGNQASISHTPAAAGDYKYKVVVIDGNGCENTAEVNVKVDAVTVAGTLSAPTNVCISNPSGTLTLSGYTGSIVKWESKPASGSTWTAVTGNTNPTLNFSGLTASTDYRVTVKNGVCTEATVEARVNVDALPVGGKLSFAGLVTNTNDGRIMTICQGATSGYRNIDLSGHSGTILAWKYSVNGAPWMTIAGETGNVLSASKIQSLNLPNTTVFRVEIGSGACTPNAFSQTAILSVIASDIKPTPVTVDKAVVCIGEEVTLSSETGYSQGIPTVNGGSFDNAGLKNDGWRFRFNGNDANFETNANNVIPDFWSRATPRNFPTANITTSPYSTTGQLWDSAVEDGNKGFAIVSGIHKATMETNIFSIGSMDQAILTFDQAYNLTPGATLTVEISRDGGATYEKVLFSRTGSASSGNYGSFGTGTPQTRPNNKMVLDLGDYLGQNNLRVRFSYVGARTGDIWAVDAIKVPSGPRNVTIEWNDYTNPNQVVQIGTTNSVKYIPKQIGLNIFEVKTKLVFDSAGNTCPVAVNAVNIEVFVFDKYTTSTTAVVGSCGNNSAQLNATVKNASGTVISTFPTPDGYIGEWVIEGGTGYTLIDSNTADQIAAINDPNAILSANEVGTFKASYILKPTIKNPQGVLYENKDCKPAAATLDVVFKACTTLDFDGVDDFVDLGTTYTGNYSFEAWVRPTRAGGTIISGPNFKVTAPSGLTLGQWAHIAVTSGKLFINGIESTTAPSTGPGGSKALIGALWNGTAATDFFQGWIEEVRIWSTAITQEQIQFLMNQRLQNEANIGELIPMPVPGTLTYSNLAGYYRLISANPDPAGLVTFDPALKPLNGVTVDLATNAVPGVLKNMTTNQENTAPLPYFSGSNGAWDTAGTWARPTVWKIPHTGGIEWNIVKSLHNITADREIKVLGLLSEVNTLAMVGTNPSGWVGGGTGNPLHISHYLNLDGVIDLQGESQLLQPIGSILDAGSTGSLQRDQQGTANSYNYNYWSSPVSPTAGSATYSVAGVLRDGTNPAIPGTITFGDPYAFADAGKTSPIKISNYWIAIFKGPFDEYNEWEFQYGSGNPIQVGEGYTMKGTSGAVPLATSQNYTFIGLPNNGAINLASTTDNNYLLGNPYPSAMDARIFIEDNITRDGKNYFDGTLYFWDHFGKVDSHVLLDYVGGYAALNLTGAVSAISVDERIHDNLDKNDKYPGPYIPVGQGFFVNTSSGPGYTISAGEIQFKNSQREFVTESEPDNSQFMKPEVQTKNPKKEELEKIRISFKSPLGYYRQILVGAIPSTTNGFDLGYDAPLYDNNKEDMYWIQGDNWLVIQGVPDFEKNQVLQLGVNLKDKGEFTIKIDELENIADSKNIYIRDKELNIIQDLRKSPYKATAEGGYSNERFEIVFYKEVATDEEPPVETPPKPDPGIPDGGEGEGEDITTLTVRHSNTTKEIQILNPDQLPLSNLYIFDMTGKQVMHYRNLSHDKEVRLPVRNYSSGVYTIKLYSDGKAVTKKIIINN